MQKKALFNPRQTLVLAYLLAVVLWLVRCLAGSAVMLNYKMQGKMPQVTLAPDELTTQSFAAYSRQRVVDRPGRRSQLVSFYRQRPPHLLARAGLY